MRREPGECFADVAGVQLSETFCVEVFCGLISRAGLPTKFVIRAPDAAQRAARCGVMRC
jgi:hypothetical protein